MSERPLLRVTNLTKHFPVRGGGRRVVHAVDDVTFHIDRGTTFGLVGESGCGKSSCARTIIRIYDPTSGSVELDGQEIAACPARELMPMRRRMQMIFQDPYASLNARMTVRDIIAEPLNAHFAALSRAQADEMIFAMLEKVGLTREHANRYAHEFSGGQRQRVGIARALILRPDLVICDEPISALDVSIQAQIVNMLRDFQQELGLTYLFIAHDLSMVRYVSDHVGVMYLGQLVEMCAADEIYSHPLHPYTQGLLQSIPIPDPRLARLKTASGLEGDLPSPIDPPAGCRFHTRCPYAMAVCALEQPPLCEAAPGHCVACHLHTPRNCDAKSVSIE
ncbi:MAG: ATP-binding cassette domain-containing protein [Clostridiales bacterium]|nr:ATP-binding cassette domain-containing protein [Clostridiales bacterium]